ncbi:hypothetical protein ES708_29387 [subsurface metagenome]
MMATSLALQHFAVLTIAYSHTATSIIITITTNNPCHLTCYYTDKEPGSHRTSRNQRGLTLPWGVYFCFVAWKSVEQTEAGDTLTHTFEVPDWSYCQTKWFAFRGTIAEVLSPSVSCLFQHHHPGIPIVQTFIARTTDGYLSTPTHIYDYILAHDGTRARPYDTDEQWSVGQELAAGMYFVMRAGLFFDTSEIPAGAQIISATLSYLVKAKYGWDYDIVIVSGDDLSEPLQNHHYHDLLDDIVSLGSAPAADGYYFQHIPLNELGLTHIKPAGLTKLALRTNEDIDYIPPTLWHFQVARSAEYRTKPYLTVSYHR